jgi:hypothetical protein
MKRFCCAVLLLGAVMAGAADFPRVAGWKPTGPPVGYDASGLWQHIDGAAEQFEAYGFEFLQVCDLVSAGVQVTVSVYDMGRPLQAFGIYGVETTEGGDFLAIGTSAELNPPYQGLLLKDRYYVKVEAPAGGLTDSIGMDLLAALAEALPGEDRLPGELSLLPAQGKVAGSEAYTREGFLGLSELRNCVHARYLPPAGDEYRIFVLLPAAGQTTRSVFEGLGPKWRPIPHEMLSILTRTIPYQGSVWIVLGEHGLWGVAGLKDDRQFMETLPVLLAG